MLKIIWSTLSLALLFSCSLKKEDIFSSIDFENEANNVLELNNVVSSSHTRIPGTDFKMIVPQSFFWANNINGFVTRSGKSYVNIIPIDTAGYDKYAINLSKESLTLRAFDIEEHQLIRYNGLKSIYIEMEIEEGYRDFLLLLGDKETCTLIEARVPTMNKVFQQNVKASLMSIAPRSTEYIEVLVDHKNTRFKFVDTFQGEVVLSELKDVQKSVDQKKAILSFKRSDKSDLYDEDLKSIVTQSLSYMQDLFFEEVDVIHEKSFEVNGFPAHEIYFKGRNKLNGAISFSRYLGLERANEWVIMNYVNYGLEDEEAISKDFIHIYSSYPYDLTLEDGDNVSESW